LYERLRAVKGAMQQCWRNYTVISAHENRLHSDAVRSHFTQAEAELTARYKRYGQLRDEIQQAIDALKKALKEGIPRRYPGSESQAPSSPSVSETPGGIREVDDLPALDRRRKLRYSPDTGYHWE